jgi:hypothetical protein
MSKIFLSFFGIILVFSVCWGLFYNRGLIFGDKVVTSASVTKYEPLNHSSVYYKYTVGGHEYEGVAMTEGYSKGEKITIEYLKKKPWISDFSEVIPTPLSFFLFRIGGALFLSGGACLVWHFNNTSSQTHHKFPDK